MDQQLLVEISEPDGNFCCKHIKLGLTAFANLATGAIGVGILSFPFAFKSSGIVLTLCMMVLFSGVNVLTLGSLCYAKYVHACPFP
jgi:amino acid permease